MTDIPTVGERIRAKRQARKLTQEALAAASKLDRTYVSQIEAGKRRPSIDALAAIAAALGTTMDHLQGRG
jgi:transcriptional regulator with XRE-family HTH domain